MTCDDPFDDIVAGLELESEPDDVLDVTQLPDVALVHMLTNLNEELTSSGQLLNPRSEWAREQHSLRNAIQLEMRKRGLA